MKQLRNRMVTYGMGENISTHKSDKGLVSQIYKELIQFNKQKDLVKRWAEKLNRHFTKEVIQMTNRYIKRFSCVCAKLFKQPPTLCNPMDYFPGKNDGVTCHALQGIFLTQGLNPRLLGLLHWQAGFLPLSPPGKLEKMLNQGIIQPHAKLMKGCCWMIRRGILGLRRRRIQSRARDKAGSLRAFV